MGGLATGGLNFEAWLRLGARMGSWVAQAPRKVLEHTGLLRNVSRGRKSPRRGEYFSTKHVLK